MSGEVNRLTEIEEKKNDKQEKWRERELEKGLTEEKNNFCEFEIGED